MKRLLVVDDVSLFRSGLRAALTAAGYDVIGEASDAERAVAAAASEQPDIILLDILMPGLSGIQVLGEIQEVSPSSKVLLLTGSESEEDLVSAIRGGARGYILKDTPLDVLVTMIEIVLSGGSAISPVMAGKLFTVTRELLLHQEVISTRKPTLTGREIEVLGLVAEGKTSPQIGDLLFISENTVKNHIRNILDKLGLRSRNEAVLYAIRENWIVLPSRV